MKIINKRISVTAQFPDSDSGFPEPVRFTFQKKGSRKEVFVDKIIEKHEEKLLGVPTIRYVCQSLLSSDDGEQSVIPFELIFDKVKCRWFLYKI